MSAFVRRANLRHLRRHPWLALLCIVGIALGVAVVLAIDVANESARRSFRLTAEAVAGRATHRIVAGSPGVPEELVARIGRELPNVAPIVEGDVQLLAAAPRAMTLLGVDPFAERPFRPALAANTTGADLGRLLVDPDAVLLLDDTARELGLELGDSLSLRVGDRTETLELAGTLSTEDPLQRSALASVVIADIATAQERLAMPGVLSRIDLVVDEDDTEALARITAMLPANVIVERAAARSGALEQMTRAFELNLRALGLLALVVGTFLIYNTMTFLVVQRRPLFGTLRAAGATRGQLFAALTTEAAMLGLAGTGLGLVLGLGLAHVLVDRVAGTISDLYFAVSVRDVEVSTGALIRAFGLGLGATLAAASIPALEATRTEPRGVMRRADLERGARARAPKLAAVGLGIGALGLLAFAWPTRSIIVGYAGLFAVIVAFAAVTPLWTRAWAAILQRPAAAMFGIVGRLAVGSVTANLSRTAVAIAALSVAVSATIGVGTMVASFRQSVERWLEDTLAADIYVTMPSAVAARASEASLDPALVERIASTAGIRKITTNRSVDVMSPSGERYRLTALAIDEETERRFELLEGDSATVWPAFHAGAVLVSEPFARRHGVTAGDELELLTRSGAHSFAIAAVFRDYASDQGYVVLHGAVYRERFGDPGLTALGLFVESSVDPERLVEELNRISEGRLRVRSTASLRRDTLEVFDRTFAITSVLQVLTAIVAFIGIVAALTSLQLERAREFAVLRARGASGQQLAGMIAGQTLTMGVIAGLLAIPLGAALAAILTGIINERAFGWSLELVLAWPEFAGGALLAITAALLAGVYPAWSLRRLELQRSLRSE